MTVLPNRRARIAALLVIVLVAGVVVVIRSGTVATRTNIVAYFANTNGVYVGDEVRVLGIPVGQIDNIEPEPHRVKVSMWVQDKYPIPENASAVIISPSLVTARAVQLTPAWREGPRMSDGAVIPEQRTAVPVEWDDLRVQLEKLTESLQPTGPDGVSALGAFVNTAADNMRGQGANFREALVNLAQAFSILGDHSDDIFGSVRSLSILVSALQDSAGLMRELNVNLAAVTALLSNQPDEVGRAAQSIADVAGDVQSFVAENRETVGTTADKLASLTTAVTESLDDVKQTLHIAPTALSNFVNIYRPAQGSLAGAISMNNFANPISFLCGAIQAASRLSAEQSAKLCVQYLAPIIKNRQYNFLPLGINPFVGTMARPNEVTYSEERLRPNYVPPALPAPHPAGAADGTPPALSAPDAPPLPAEAVPADPAAGLEGLMVPGAGS